MIRVIRDRHNLPELLGSNDSMDVSFAEAITEGEIKSYPTDVVVRQLIKLFRLDDPNLPYGRDVNIKTASSSSYRHDKFNDIQTIQVLLGMNVLDDELEGQIERMLKQCGWFIGDRKEDSPFTILRLEPRYPIISSRQRAFSEDAIRRRKKFYHVSFAKYIDKILSIGLIPSKTQRGEFFHPDRVYLFGRKEDAENFMSLHDVGVDMGFKKRQNTRTIGNNPGKIADMKYQSILGEPMVMFEVDLGSYFNDRGKPTILFHDPSWHEDECSVFFTQEIIPAKYIEQIGE